MTDKTAWEGHTPLPWRNCEIGSHYDFEIAGPDGEMIAECEWYSCSEVECRELQANAALIVHCVNNFPALEAERDALREALHGLADILEHDGDIDPCVSSHAPVEHYLGLARQALAISEKSE